MKDSLLRLVNAKTSLAEFVEIFTKTIRQRYEDVPEHEDKLNTYLIKNCLEFDDDSESLSLSNTFLSGLPNHPKLKLVSECYYKNVRGLSLVDVKTGTVVNDIASTSESFLNTLRNSSWLNFIRCIFILYGEMLGDKNIANFPRIDKNTVEPEVYETIKDLVELVLHKCVECELGYDLEDINITNTILVEGFENNEPFF